MFPHIRTLKIALLLAVPLQLQAQSGSVWEPVNKAAATSKSNVAKGRSAIRDWKKHIVTWGLDSTYNRSLSFGGRLNSDGWSGLITYGRKSGQGRLSYWQLGFSEVKHEKETKLQGSNAQFKELGSGASYIYGKSNNAYLIQLSYQRERVILPGVLAGNIGMAFKWGGGISLAVQKPYYLRLIYPDISAQTAQVREESISDDNRERFLNGSLILGRGRWASGLDQMTYTPGLHVEGATVLYVGKRAGFIPVINLGVQAGVFSRPIHTLVDANGSSLRLVLFGSIELGKRWLTATR